MKELSHRFLLDLQEGELKTLLSIVKMDDTLNLAIRENCVEVYYRGGVLLRVTANRYMYQAEFDESYAVRRIKGGPGSLPMDKLKTLDDYLRHIPLLKKELDRWFCDNPKKEREYEQVILRENNWGSAAEETDYFIADLDYYNPDDNARFDLLAVKWPCKEDERINCKIPKLSILDLKYGDRAFSRYNGFDRRFADLEKYIEGGRHRVLALEVESLFNQRVELGLMRNVTRKLEVDSNGKLEYLILFANHKPSDKKVLEALDEACRKHEKLMELVDMKVATASFLGYGLFEANMIPVQKFLESQMNLVSNT